MFQICYGNKLDFKLGLISIRVVAREETDPSLASRSLMAEQTNQPRALAPRRLDQKESLHSLNHWKSVFRNYYRRCPYYSRFLLPTAKWNNSAHRGFSSAETTGLKRDVDTLVADLEGFLDCLASYLPFDYVAEKLKQESTNITSAWSIIYAVPSLGIGLLGPGLGPPT